MYAYAFRLLGFGPFLTSGSLSKKSFLTDWARTTVRAVPTL